jgi:predicted Zn finger-like uncharacterized protein
MSLDIEESFPVPPKRDKDEALNGHDCPHCGLWFRLDNAKPAGKNKVRCPDCGWVIEGVL